MQAASMIAWLRSRPSYPAQPSACIQPVNRARQSLGWAPRRCGENWYQAAAGVEIPHGLSLRAWTDEIQRVRRV